MPKAGNKMRFTKRSIESLEARPARYSIFSEDIPGFGVRVEPSGTKAFFLKYWTGARQEMKTIGKFGQLTVQEAEQEARRLLGMVAGGENPAQALRGFRAQDTFGEFAERYMAEYSSKKNKPRTQADNRRLLDRYLLPAWRNLKLSDIRRRDVVALQAAIARPYEANHAMRLARTMFNRAVRWDLIESNPAALIEQAPESARRNPMKPDAVAAFARALNAEPNPYFKGLGWMLLFTGMRPGEALGLQWAQVDLADGIAHLPDTKGGRVGRPKPQDVVLSSFAVNVLENLPRSADGQFVFPGRRPGNPLRETKGAWARFRQLEPALERHILRDTRATVATWLGELGFAETVASDVLRHSRTTVTGKHYAAESARLIREALERYGRAVMVAVEGGDPFGAPPAEVIPLREAVRR